MCLANCSVWGFSENHEKSEVISDGRTDGPTDRRSELQSRVHATKNNPQGKCGEDFRKIVIEEIKGEGMGVNGMSDGVDGSEQQKQTGATPWLGKYEADSGYPTEKLRE